MSSTRRMIRQTLTIARRDFVGTVFTPIFLLFLFAPMIFGSIGGLVGGLSAASMAGGGRGDRSRIVAIVPPAQARVMADADARLRKMFRSRDEAPPAFTTLAPRGAADAQARAAFESTDFDARAVLYGPLAAPTVLVGPRAARAADYLGLLAGATLTAERLGGTAPAVVATKVAFTRTHPTLHGPNPSAFFAVFGIFFLTLFLAGQMVGTMAEERSNKVIEVLAAAVPLESVFLGKLIGMLGVALLFVAFWGTVVGNVGALMPPAMGAGMAELSPAVGLPTFSLLFIAYFVMAYLLLGSVFLGIGAQASTMREIQMLSLPITFLQMGMFGLAAAAASAPGSTIATVAEVFPLSSPFAMAGLAANRPEIWPHLLALVWQLLWVAIFITIGARLFRRGVLQSGSARTFRPRRKPVDTVVS